MSRPRGRFARSKARQGDSLRHQIPAPCPHSPLTGFTLIGALTEGYLRDRIGGLIHGGAYFRNFTVYYYAMKESMWGGPSKTIFKKKLKEIKDQNKRVHKKLEGGCLWF